MNFEQPKMPERKPQMQEEKIENIDSYEKEKLEFALGTAKRLIESIEAYMKINEYADKHGKVLEKGSMEDQAIEARKKLDEINDVFANATLNISQNNFRGEEYANFLEEIGDNKLAQHIRENM